MKRSIVIIGTAIISAICPVLAQNSSVVLYTENGERFTAILNGIQQNADVETNVKITGLNAPSYRVQIVFDIGTFSDVQKTIYLSEPGNQYTFAIISKKGSHKLAFRNSVPIAQVPSANAGQQAITYTTEPPPVAVATTFTTTETITTTTGGMATPVSDHVSMNVAAGVHGVGFNLNVNVNDGHAHDSHTSYTTTSTTSYSTTNSGSMTGTSADWEEEGPSHYMMPGYSGPIGCPWPMNAKDLSDVRNSISDKSFEDSKLTMARQVAGANCLESAQVRDIMRLFTYESSKLEFAKLAYPRTHDIGNYYKVNDAFEFESSIDALTNYIGN